MSNFGHHFPLVRSREERAGILLQGNVHLRGSMCDYCNTTLDVPVQYLRQYTKKVNLK